MRLWGIIRKKQKMIGQYTVALASADTSAVWEAMDEILHKLDLSRPVILSKHESEWENYGRTAFLPQDFIESVPFDRFEIELLTDDSGASRRSNDYRNDFSI